MALTPTNRYEARELVREMERHYSRAFQTFKEDDKFYDGDFESMLALPEGFEPTIPATGRAVVDEAVDNIIPADFSIHYAPRGLTKKAEEDADLIRRHCKAVIKHWRKHVGDIDFMRDFAKNLFRSGVAAWKLVPDWTLWPVLDEKTEAKLMDEDGTGKARLERVRQIKELRQLHNPMVVRSLNPLCFMADPSIGPRKLWFVERYECDISEIRNQYAGYTDELQGFPNYGHHKIHEVWTATYADASGEIFPGKHWVFINDQAVVDGDANPYHDLPYVVKFSGFGRESYDGRPEFKSVGFFTPQVKSLLLAEARRFSQFDAIMAQLAFPIGMLPDSVDPDSFDTSPGAMNFVSETVLQHADKIWLKAAIPDGEYLNSLRVIGGQIERGTTQVPLRGAPVPGTDSAAQLGMYTGQAKLRLSAAESGLSDGLGLLLSRYLWYIDHILEGDVAALVGDQPKGKYVVGPRNIQGNYEVEVTFLPNEEAVKERKLALASDAVVKGGLSPYDALVYAGFDNATEIIERRMAYDMMQEPLVKRALAKKILEQWGEDADALAMEEQKDQGEQQMMLKQFMDMLQMGTMTGVGDPMSPDGAPLPNNQDPMAALAQQGGGPMPMPVGNVPMDPNLLPPEAMQQMPMPI